MSKVFEARLSSPANNNKYYISTVHGGYNRCIIISDATGSCLPNCVGYAYGRFMEEAGLTKCNLSRANAENWYGYTQDGYKRGSTPQIGAVMCWRRGIAGNANDGAGHVGVVEEINGDEITVSMSAYKGYRFGVKKFKKGAYNYNGLTFQGFIYNPYVVVKAATKPSAPSDNTITKYVKGSGIATKFTKNIAGSYKTTANLNLRDAAGTNHKSLVVLPKGTTVQCYGYYTLAAGVNWYYVVAVYNHVQYTGFCSSQYLKRS